MAISTGRRLDWLRLKKPDCKRVLRAAPTEAKEANKQKKGSVP
jgi:hypothetical protein